MHHKVHTYYDVEATFNYTEKKPWHHRYFPVMFYFYCENTEYHENLISEVHKQKKGSYQHGFASILFNLNPQNDMFVFFS